VAKDSARIDAIGAVDELNSALGLVLAESVPDEVRACLTDVQHDLFDLGGELSIPGYAAVTDAHVAFLEEAVERFNAPLSPLKEFLLPGGCRAAALAHVARTICRRCERTVVHLAATEAVSDPVRRYLNRLSDLLFVLARTLNVAAGRTDVLWHKGRQRGAGGDG
jgi:cob(I)alamin adenosyltransferase